MLVVNTRSRRGRHLFADARRLLAERNVVLDAAYSVRDPVRLPEIVRDAVAEGHGLIIVGGGDGTISSVVDYLAFKPVVLGVLPLGTANSFARTLDIPMELEAAIAVIADGKIVDVDLGRIGSDLFANAAAIGMPSVVAQGIPHGLKRRLGRLAYPIYGLYALLRYRSFRCTLDSGEQRQTMDALEVRIANGSYLGGVQISDEAHVESEDLEIQVIKGRSRWTLIRSWLAWGLGRQPRDADLAIMRTRDMMIETDPPRPVSIDGEVLAHTPVHVSVARQALHLMVPAHRADLTLDRARLQTAR